MPIDPRTRGSLPPNPSIKGSDFQAAMNNVYVVLVDQARRLDALEGQRTVINSQSISTGMVQTGAITTSTIAAGSITAAQIQVGNVVASIMTVGAVNASHIDSASIRASVLDATVLTATNAYITSLRASILDAGVLTAASAQIGTLRTSILNSTQIVAQGLQTQVLSAVNAAITTLASFNVTSGTITADLIRTAATGARVEIGATAGGIKGYNSSNVLTFGFDTTTGAATVGAISVTGANGTQVPASTLTGFVGGGNLLLDSSFESTDPATPASVWPGNDGVTLSKQTTQAFHGTKSLRLLNVGTGRIYGRVNVDHGVPLSALVNRPVVYSAWVYITGTDNSTPGNDFSLRISDQSTAFASASISTVPKNTWTRIILKSTIPSSSTDVYVHLWNPYTSGLNTVYYDGVQFELGDAATAYSPKADEIIYGSITAVQLAANSVTATAINAGAIDGKVITGATFQNTASNPAVRFDSTGFYITDSGGSHAVDMKSTGFQLNTPTSPTKDDKRSINWLRSSDSYVDFSVYNYSATGSGGGGQATIEKVIPTTDTAGATLAVFTKRLSGSTINDLAGITAWADGTAAGNKTTVHAKVSAGTSIVKTLLDANGNSDYLFSAAPTITTPSSGFGTHYVNYNTTFRYWKDVMGYVHIVGEINDDGTGLAALTANTLLWSALPSGYRPTVRTYFTAESSGATLNRILINTVGEIRISDNTANASRYMNLGHITFPTF